MDGRSRSKPERRLFDSPVKGLLAALLLSTSLSVTAQTAAERALDNLRAPSLGPASSRPAPSGAEHALDRLRQEQRERLRDPVYQSPILQPAPAGVSDSWLSQQARSAIRRDLLGNPQDIQIRADQGVVTLTGMVRGELELHRMREAVQSLPGVERVETSGIRIVAP